MEGVLLPVVLLILGLIYVAEWKRIGLLYIPAILLMLWVALFMGETLIYFATAGIVAFAAIRIRGAGLTGS